MNISKEEIYNLCSEYNITNYTVNSDMSIDVNGDVNLYRSGLIKLPLKFNKVSGNFYCGRNQLTSLQGCPIEIGGSFNCNDNKLTSLEGCPKEVGGDFDCYNNKLTSLEGGLKEVGGDFYCDYNNLISLVGCPNEVGGNFYCGGNSIYEIFGIFNDYNRYKKSLDYNYLRGNKVNKIRFERALEEQNLLYKLPEKLIYYEYI